MTLKYHFIPLIIVKSPIFPEWPCGSEPYINTLKKRLKPLNFIGDQNDVFAHNLSDIREDEMLSPYFYFTFG